ncbi:MAG TPA: hypothetical protein VJJ24_03555 [Candidatus Paceibacterota bacterium]
MLAVLMGVVGATGDILVNRWAATGSFRWWLMAAPFWLGMMSLLGYTLRANLAQFSVVVVIALLVNILIVLLWDTVIMKTQLLSLQLAGIVVAIVAMVLIELGRK